MAAKKFRAKMFKGMGPRAIADHIDNQRTRARKNAAFKPGGTAGRRALAQTMRESRWTLRSKTAPKSLRVLDRSNLRKAAKNIRATTHDRLGTRTLRKVAGLSRSLKLPSRHPAGRKGGQRRDAKGRFA